MSSLYGRHISIVSVSEVKFNDISSIFTAGSSRVGFAAAEAGQEEGVRTLAVVVEPLQSINQSINVANK